MSRNSRTLSFFRSTWLIGSLVIVSSEELISSEPLMSISWLRKLVDVFLCCEAEFNTVLIMGRDPSQICKPPLDRLIPELMERAVKALDICDGQVKRARKALSSMLTAMTIDDKENHCKGAERTWSFGRRGNTAGANKERAVGNFRSLSMIVAKNWSASKQILAMYSNLVAPRGGEPTGLASPVYILSSVMVFVMWALVAAVPCQERSGLATHFQIPRHLAWAHSIIALQERIAEEWKKKEKKCSAGLLEELQKMEKLGQSLIEFADGFQFPGDREDG
ncbi:hypothetical protein GH714_010558 [Hevea brasiliensis]|uniref:Uncharacterized protein n=1 Tax=Hevea brasiliensis TaxID=3981 RepID=A0A6A6MMZ7_HEVBR|nr:hypothetical protein GH714_010558 [Hevea brasiliensis]